MSRRSQTFQDNRGSNLIWAGGIALIIGAVIFAFFQARAQYFELAPGEIGVFQTVSKWFVFAKTDYQLAVGPQKIMIDKNQADLYVIDTNATEVPFGVRVVPGKASQVLDQARHNPLRNNSIMRKGAELLDKVVDVEPQYFEGTLHLQGLSQRAVARLYRQVDGPDVFEPLLGDLRDAVASHASQESSEQLSADVTEELRGRWQERYGFTLATVEFSDRRAIDTDFEELEERLASFTVTPTYKPRKGFDFHWAVFLYSIPLAILCFVAALGLLFAAPELALAVALFGGD